MVSYYIGDGGTNLGSDPNSGDEFILVPVALDHAWDQGNFGFPFPLNARVYSPVRLLGGSSGLGDGLTYQPDGPDPLNVTPLLLFGAGAGSEGFTVLAEVTPTPEIETETVVFNGVQLDIFLLEVVVFAVMLPGELPVFRVPPLTREFFAETTGVRPSFPWLIERVVRNVGEVVINGVFQFPLNKPFLVSPQLSPTTDRSLWDLGARPNYIGMVVQVERPDGSLVSAVRFRAPELFEVVVARSTDGL